MGVSLQDVLSLILTHVSVMGWDACCWSDDALSSKKIYPKYQFPAKSKKWLPRVKSSEDSMRMLVQRVQATHEKGARFFQKKLDTNTLEALAERGAAVESMGKEVQQTVPLSNEVLEKEWWGPWAAGSEHIDMEVQVHLMDKSETFLPAQHIPTLKGLVDAHLFKSGPIVQSSTQKDALEVDEFALLLKQLKYDQAVHETWQRKCRTTSGAREHAKQEMKLNRRKKAMDAATLFLKKCTKLTLWEPQRPETTVGEIMDFRRDNIASKLAITPSSIPSLLALNWAAPCLVPIPVQDNQISVLSWALSENMQSAAVVINPVFTYNKGKLHLEEGKLVDLLAKGNHNLDWQFSIIFKEKSDDRDLRPMVYPGRFVFPSPLGDPKKNMFFMCELRKSHRTEEVKQLTAKGMKLVEDLAEDALPPTTEIRDSTVHGAAKYCQLGVQAWDKVIEGTLSGADLKDVPALLIVDLFPRPGDLIQAFCAQRALQSNTSLFYLGVCTDQVELTYIQSSVTDSLADKYLDGSLTVVGDPLPKEVNEEALDPFPPVPPLNRLTLTQDEKKDLRLPVELVKKWHMHPSFGAEFCQWMDSFLSNPACQILDSEVKEPETPNPKKRPSEEMNDLTTPVKKVKIEGPTVLVEASSIPEALLFETKMFGKDVPMLQLRANHSVYIFNRQSQEWSSDHGFVCGFGRGTFKMVKLDGSDAPEKSLQFKISSQDDLVVLNGIVMDVGSVVRDQRAKKPDAQICYHSIKVDQAGPNNFNIEVTHNVVFLIKNDGLADKDLNCHNIASKEELKVWTSDVLKTLWVVRWAAKGLMPVKPVVHLNGSLNLLPGRACRCSA